MLPLFRAVDKNGMHSRPLSEVAHTNLKIRHRSIVREGALSCSSQW